MIDIKQHIDPVFMREERERIAKQEDVLRRGGFAADALLWFEEYDKNPDATKTITIKAELVASSTPNADKAQRYVDWARNIAARAILDEARRLAMAELATAQERMKR